MVEHDNYGKDRAVHGIDLGPIALALAAKLAETGVLKPGIKEPHVHVRSALEAVIKKHGDEVIDLAWKDGNVINRHDETLGFAGAPGVPVQKRCHRLILTVVPTRWSPRITKQKDTS